MAKLLETRLPLANGSVEPDLYNRLVRILELSLDGFDPTATYQYTDTIRNQNLFNRGDIIWNLTELALQVYDGAEWQTLYAPSGKGVSATGELGTITVQASGSTTVSIS